MATAAVSKWTLQSSLLDIIQERLQDAIASSKEKEHLDSIAKLIDNSITVDDWIKYTRQDLAQRPNAPPAALTAVNRLLDTLGLQHPSPAASPPRKGTSSFQSLMPACA